MYSYNEGAQASFFQSWRASKSVCIVLINLPCCTCTNQASNLFTSDTPDAPINVTAEELPDSDPNDDSCILVIDLRPPSNIDENHIKNYFIQFPSGDETIPNTGSGLIRVPNCTDIHLNVSAVNSCGTIGASAIGIEPKFISTSTPTTSTPTSTPTTSAPTTSASTTNESTGPGSESSSTLASTTLCAVLLVIGVLSS